MNKLEVLQTKNWCRLLRNLGIITFANISNYFSTWISQQFMKIPREIIPLWKTVLNSIPRKVKTLKLGCLPGWIYSQWYHLRIWCRSGCSVFRWNITKVIENYSKYYILFIDYYSDFLDLFIRRNMALLIIWSEKSCSPIKWYCL